MQSDGEKPETSKVAEMIRKITNKNKNTKTTKTKRRDAAKSSRHKDNSEDCEQTGSSEWCGCSCECERRSWVGIGGWGQREWGCWGQCFHEQEQQQQQRWWQW